MRKLAFQVVIRATALTIWVIEKITWVVVGIPAFVLLTLKVNAAKLGMFLATLLDQQRLLEAEERIEGRHEAAAHNMELSLLHTAALLRDNAKETGNWTDEHTNALNGIGEALMVECEWEEEDVHATLARIVESIDGLEYHVEEEYEDE